MGKDAQVAAVSVPGHHLVHELIREIRNVVQASRVSGSQVHDARIAALCALHGVTELWTADRDFGRFPGIKVRNPLVG